MILDRLRRAYRGYFGQGATPVPPENSPPTDDVAALVRSIIADAEARKLADVVLDPNDMSWDVWAGMEVKCRAPGWTFCRLGARWNDRARQVFGIVREDIGVWSKPFMVHPSHQRRTLWVMTHVPTGLGLGLFMEREYALQAAELLHRVVPAELAELDPDVPSTFGMFMPRLRQTFTAAGLFVHDGHASDDDSPSGRFVVWDRSAITAPTGSMLS